MVNVKPVDQYSYKAIYMDQKRDIAGYVDMPALREPSAALGVMMHEMVHYITTRQELLYKKSPAESEKHFGFGLRDYQLYHVGRRFYVSPASYKKDSDIYDKTLNHYRNHPEERLAYDIQYFIAGAHTHKKALGEDYKPKFLKMGMV
jgi:hypothetical protein